MQTGSADFLCLAGLDAADGSSNFALMRAKDMARISNMPRFAARSRSVVGKLSHFRPQIGRDYPLNLSISLSGGKETNKDSLSNGE